MYVDLLMKFCVKTCFQMTQHHFFRAIYVATQSARHNIEYCGMLFDY